MIFAALFLITSSAMAQDVVMTEYETKFAYTGKTHAPRAANIELAASLLDVSAIEPGGEWSFNEAVGPRNEKRGFKKAKAIIHRRLKKDFGGGVCQVASTLHAAALSAGLSIIEHHPHSRVSAYIHPSLDATVVWGQMDLRIQNPYPFKVWIDTDTSTPGVLKVSIWGAKKPNVTLFFQIQETTDFESVTWYRNDWKKGRRKVQEPGTLGHKLTRFRVFKDGRGVSSWEKKTFAYRPSSRIVLLGTKEEEVLVSSTPR
jgi:vancomycin resistance protein YoaR